MKKRHQHYALDESNKLIHIKDVDKDKKQFYRCPNCKQEMIARQGKIRDWHFAHKKKECEYDRYLHSLAEIKISKWFNKEKTILLKLNSILKCSNFNSCMWFDKSNCERQEGKKLINLKDYFESCSIEKEFKKNNNTFVADIFCPFTNKNGEENPLFIEIYVTHKCEKEKLDSGIKIIEVMIENEQDIDDFISHPIIENDKTRFYNFRPNNNYSDILEFPIQKFILFSSGKSYVDKKNYTCKNYNKQRTGVFEATIEYDVDIEDCIPSFWGEGGLYAIGQALAYRENSKHRHCYLCRWEIFNEWERSNICKLSKAKGTNKYCIYNNAYNCTYFQLDKEKYDNYISSIKIRENAGTIDIWKSSDWK